jgi:hypothetical protein
MTNGSDMSRKALNLLILIALAIAAAGSVLFAIFRSYLARFAGAGF